MKRAAVIVAVMLIAAAGILWWAVRRAPAPPQQQKPAPAKPRPKPPREHRLTMRGVEVREKSADGRSEWVVKARGEVVGDKASGKIEAKAVVWSLQEQGRPAAEARAAKAILDYGARTVVLAGNVTARADELKFTAPKLSYDMDTGLLKVSGPATITKGPTTMRVAGATVNIRAKKVVARRVRVTYRF